MYTKARFGSIPDNEKWIGKKSGEGGGRQVADGFFGCAYISAPCNRHVEFQESRGVGASERGLERNRKGRFYSNMGIPSFWASQFSKP